MKEVFLDTETTGLSTKDNHRIVEIACIETEGLIPTNKIFHKQLNPERDVSEDAVKVHGFTYDYLRTKPTFDKIASDFLKFIEGKKLIIHNAPFDLGFLNYELNLLDIEGIKKNVVVDSLETAKLKFPGQSNSLDALCKRFGIDLSRRSKHNALLDCELLREVYINLVDAKEPKLVFPNKVEAAIIDNDGDYSKKIINISEMELEKHKKFIKKEIKKNNFY